MKIFYYQRPDLQPNFGDELNHWLWPKLLPKIFDEDGSTLFIGLGTLLNNALIERTKTAKRVIIFSSGAGYEQPLEAIPKHWKVLCVRGPLSAQKLHLPQDKAITDGGLLVHRCFQPSGKQTSTYAFMPHIHHAIYASQTWQAICADADIKYIDPRWPIEKVLKEISETAVLMAEAMHGAIVADALRVPWIPIITSPKILTFKWQDWCQSIGLKYRPKRLIGLDSYPRLARGIRSSFRASPHWIGAIQQRLLHYPTESRLATQLGSIASQSCPQLSTEQTFKELTLRLESALHCLMTEK